MECGAEGADDEGVVAGIVVGVENDEDSWGEAEAIVEARSVECFEVNGAIALSAAGAVGVGIRVGKTREV